MKIFHLLLAALFALPCSALAQETWVINDFQSDIVIAQDGAVVVSETLLVDFGNNQKHGIIRVLPYRYEDEQGKSTYTRVEDITVMQDGRKAEIDITKENQYISIRIGDPEETITGKHRYEIRYMVAGVLRAFEGFDELSWNVTGNGWEVPIASARATVRVPATILQTACYEGPYGSRTPCATNTTQSQTVSFSSTNLSSGEGLTVAVGFESGVIPIIQVDKPPSLLDVLVSKNTWITFLLVSILGIGLLLRHGYRYGRDRYWQRSHLPGVRSDRQDAGLTEKILPLWHRRTVVVEYDSPDNLRPAEIGVLMDERADTLDISATIVDLASRGFLEITEISKKWMFGKADYIFTCTDKKDENLMRYEQVLLERLFDGASTVTMSDLQSSFYTDLQKVKHALYEEVVTKKLFPLHPTTVRTIYIGVGVALMFGGVATFVLLLFVMGQAQTLQLYHQLIAGLSAAVVICGIATVVASPFMPRKTAYGRELYTRALGYKLFISTTEKHRAKFLENEGLFWELLPYAIVFGVTDKLARAFERMGMEPQSPSWYHGSGPFHAAVFLSHMNSFSHSLGTAMASTPTSSSSTSGGGGFSGGGFGGGGGGSW